MYDEYRFLEQLQSSIENNRITLPTLPEVALRVRDAVGQENVTAPKIAEMVATDAAVSARLLQVANSPLYRGRMEIDNIQMAITRLGNRMVRSLVVSLAMQQIFQATSDVLDRRFRRIWETSVQVAGVSRVLARPLDGLETEQAMLAGLIHNIGALPILVMAEDIPELSTDEAQLDFLLDRLSPTIGRQILESWNFPKPLVMAAEHFNDFVCDSGPRADYVDVVIVARLQTLIGTDHPDALIDWTDISAFTKVGLAPDVEVVEMEGVAQELQEVEEIFL